MEDRLNLGKKYWKNTRKYDVGNILYNHHIYFYRRSKQNKK